VLPPVEDGEAPVRCNLTNGLHQRKALRNWLVAVSVTSAAVGFYGYNFHPEYLLPSITLMDKR
jgi:hypothetical protein